MKQIHYLYIAFMVVIALSMSGCKSKTKKSVTEKEPAIKLITLDPGHFHAALVQKTIYPQVSNDVHVYAPAGNDLDEHLKRIEVFNTRLENPTHWNEIVYTGQDFPERMIQEKKGNVVIIAGNNQKKTEYILKALQAGINVLADKPMVIVPENFELLKQCFDIAKEKNLLLCWGMNLKYPTKISSMGGRYYYRDDWETPDTQTVSLEFGNEATLLWEGQSCNGKLIEDSSVGVIFYGDKGSLYISGGNDYKIFDKKNKLIKDVQSEVKINAQNTVSPAQHLDALHILNFFDAIQKGAPQNMTVEAGHKCTLLMQLANISLRTGRTLNINSNNGQIVNDNESQQYWSRSYEPGWEPKI